MFERVIDDILQTAIDAGTANTVALRQVFDTPGRSASELDKLVAYFTGEGKPQVIHGYARPGMVLPAFTIVLQSGSQETFFVGDEAGAYAEGVEEFRETLEEAAGKDVDVGVQRWRFTYGIYTLDENPDVVIAYHNLVRRSMLEATGKFLDEAAEEPRYDEQDLQPFPKYLPDSVYGRVFRATLSGNLFFGLDLDLGPLAVGRGTSIRGMHISNNVTGVDGNIDPVES